MFRPGGRGSKRSQSWFLPGSQSWNQFGCAGTGFARQDQTGVAELLCGSNSSPLKGSHVKTCLTRHSPLISDSSGLKCSRGYGETRPGRLRVMPTRYTPWRCHENCPRVVEIGCDFWASCADAIQVERGGGHHGGPAVFGRAARGSQAAIYNQLFAESGRVAGPRRASGRGRWSGNGSATREANTTLRTSRMTNYPVQLDLSVLRNSGVIHVLISLDSDRPLKPFRDKCSPCQLEPGVC
jgi:hypothetical protein